MSDCIVTMAWDRCQEMDHETTTPCTPCINYVHRQEVLAKCEVHKERFREWSERIGNEIPAAAREEKRLRDEAHREGRKQGHDEAVDTYRSLHRLEPCPSVETFRDCLAALRETDS